MTDATTPRGTPPGDKQLAKRLGPQLTLWQAALAVATEFGATWRWAHSEATGTWSYRSYLAGDRFFCALSLTESGFELSVNLKPEEWDFMGPIDASERAFVEELQRQALASGDDPAWVHVPVDSEARLRTVTQLLLARGRRVQAPRTKKRKHR